MHPTSTVAPEPRLDRRNKNRPMQRSFAELRCSSGEITAGQVTQVIHQHGVITSSQLQPSPTLTLRPLVLVAPLCTCAGEDSGGTSPVQTTSGSLGLLVVTDVCAWAPPPRETRVSPPEAQPQPSQALSCARGLPDCLLYRLR